MGNGSSITPTQKVQNLIGNQGLQILIPANSESEESKSLSMIDQKKLEIGEFFLESHSNNGKKQVLKKKLENNVKKWDSYLKKIKKTQGLMKSTELPQPKKMFPAIIATPSPSNSCTSTLTFDSTLIQLFFKKNKSKFLSKVNHSPGPPMKYRFICWRTIMNIPNGCSEIFTQMKKKKANKIVERDIKNDLHRTYPSQPMFKMKNGSDMTLGERQLCNTLKALANNFPRIGYCQGMNFVVGFMLLISGGNEAESFNLFQKMGLDLRFHVLGLYENNFPLVSLYVFIFWRLLEETDQDLKLHIEKLGVPDHAWISKWFMMIFLYSLPLDIICRVWDFLFSEESFTATLKIAIALMKILKPDLMKFDEIVEIMEYFKILKGGLYEPYKSMFLDNIETIKSKHITLKGDILVRKARKVKITKKMISESTHKFLQQNPQFKDHILLKFYEKYDNIDSKEFDYFENKIREYFQEENEENRNHTRLSFDHMPLLTDNEEFVGVNKLKNIPIFDINNLVIFQNNKKKGKEKNEEEEEDDEEEGSSSEGEFITNKTENLAKINEKIKANFH